METTEAEYTGLFEGAGLGKLALLHFTWEPYTYISSQVIIITKSYFYAHLM